MRPDVLPALRCVACHEPALVVEAEYAHDEVELRDADLRCERCGATWAVRDGIVELLHDAPEHVEREAAGLERFARRLQDEGVDRSTILTLPYVQDGYWFTQARSVEHAEAELGFTPGERLLDVGSNTCWASARFANAGLRVVALDITPTLMQGLRTADWWMEDGTPHFERVLGSMTDMPFADASFDTVFCCEVLHHNDLDELRTTMREAFRVLRPGGRVVAINETLRTVRDRVGNHADEIDTAQYEGHEHAYWAHQYLGAARRAGFRAHVLEPAYRPFFGVNGFTVPAGTPRKAVARNAVKYLAQRTPAARRAYLAYVSTIAANSSIGFVAVKPG